MVFNAGFNINMTFANMFTLSLVHAPEVEKNCEQYDPTLWMAGGGVFQLGGDDHTLFPQFRAGEYAFSNSPPENSHPEGRGGLTTYSSCPI